MDSFHLIDPTGALLVVGGTGLATLARSGVTDCAVTFRQIWALTKPSFNLGKARAELARPTARLEKDGVIRFAPGDLSDPAVADAANALSRTRSVAKMWATHERHETERKAVGEKAYATLEQAAELAPLFGLAGTLISLSFLSPAALGNGQEGVIQAMSLAVVSTLYGLLLAHLVLMPLAGAIARRHAHEGTARDELIAWLADHAEPVCPPCREDIPISRQKAA
jgi:chemotaxis protein MotA